MSEPVLAPVAGRPIPLAETPDPVFAAQLVGSGLALEPESGDATAVAPIAGKVVKVHPHAFVIAGSHGAVLVHLGIDTVGLNGEGFTVHATEGSTVSAGDAMVTWNPDDVAARGLSNLVLICVLDTPADQVSVDGLGDHVSAQQPLFDLPL